MSFPVDVAVLQESQLTFFWIPLRIPKHLNSTIAVRSMSISGQIVASGWKLLGLTGAAGQTDCFMMSGKGCVWQGLGSTGVGLRL